MNPELLALLCKLIGYIDGIDTGNLDLEPYMEPIEKLVNDEIELIKNQDPAEDIPQAVICLHHDDTPDDCPCDPSCYCRETVCKPVALKALPSGVSVYAEHKARGTNYETNKEEHYYFCDKCGWIKGDSQICEICLLELK